MKCNTALYVRTCEADKHVAQENVRFHPSPVGVPAIEQSQDNTEPYPVERDGPGLRVALEEEKCRSRDASENGPPVVVFHEEMAKMANCDRDDCGGLQPVGIVNWRRSRRTRDVMQLALLELSPVQQRWMTGDQRIVIGDVKGGYGGLRVASTL